MGTETMLIAAVLAGLGMAAGAPLLHRAFPRATGRLLSVIPAALTFYFLFYIPSVAANDPVTGSWSWIPTLGINLSFYLDGLSLLFVLLIQGIGTLVFAYSDGYLQGHKHQGRFYLFLSLFMAAMTGSVLADNVVTLFVFWELTTVSSFFLIGFEHEGVAAREAARQALLVTALGGLCLLAGLLLLAHWGDSLELSRIAQADGDVRTHQLYLPILLLVALGAFTKSAQVPFHFWLPAAMEAPTPVSAYLHAATMVKAGIYLLARLFPLLGGTEVWTGLLVTVGAATLLAGGWMAFLQTDLKRILAYATVCVLGTLTALLGVGTTAAIQAAVVLLLAHALYKGALFLVAGTIYHATHQRDVTRLGGLKQHAPALAAVGVLAALSSAGAPPFAGYLAKEQLYSAIAQGTTYPVALTAIAVLGNGMLVATALMVAIIPFFGAGTHRELVNQVPRYMWICPGLLAALGTVGFFVPHLDTGLLSAAAGAIAGSPVRVILTLWHGPNLIFLLSMVTAALGIAAFRWRHQLQGATASLRSVAHIGPQRWYNGAVACLHRLASWQTGVLQNGFLRSYLFVVVGTVLALVGWKLWSGHVELPALSPQDVHPFEFGIAVLILAAALMVVLTTSRLGAIAALGVIGFGVVLIYLVNGAPGLAMTQTIVEILTVIIFVLVFNHMPTMVSVVSAASRLRDAAIALAAGATMSALVLLAIEVQFQPSISSYFSENTLLLGHGRSVVNVILVDFRALDTLGEITVLGVAAIGVGAIFKMQITPRD